MKFRLSFKHRIFFAESIFLPQVTNQGTMTNYGRTVEKDSQLYFQYFILRYLVFRPNIPFKKLMFHKWSKIEHCLNVKEFQLSKKHWEKS